MGGKKNTVKSCLRLISPSFPSEYTAWYKRIYFKKKIKQNQREREKKNQQYNINDY